MTNQQLYLSIGLPILVSLLNTGLLILYMNKRFDDMYRYLEVRFKAVEDRLDKIEKRLDRLEEPRLIK